MKISVKNNLPSYTISAKIQGLRKVLFKRETKEIAYLYLNRTPIDINVVNQQVVTFETISQNINANNSTPDFYPDGSLLSYTQDTPQGNVIKTFTWVNGLPTKIELSGAIPPTIKTIKNLDWSVGQFPNITYE